MILEIKRFSVVSFYCTVGQKVELRILKKLTTLNLYSFFYNKAIF
uniref:Uncharacterized protein n=1 Tax=Chlamydia pneumoniae TaxID=83558 RepID=A0A0F7WRZ3_CHLPN|nr:hypothetical protein BN1224_DC9_CA_00080 [Chlamydia pneumoniae]